MNKEINGFFPDFLYKISGLKTKVFGFFLGYGGFRELREAHRKHFHLSWPISARGQKLWPKTLGGNFCLPSTVGVCIMEHFHLFWYLSVSVVTSCGHKPWGCLPSTDVWEGWESHLRVCLEVDLGGLGIR